MYNRVHRAQSKRLILKSYINGINTSILPKKHNENMFFEKLFNELHDLIEKHPNVRPPPPHHPQC